MDKVRVCNYLTEFLYLDSAFYQFDTIIPVRNLYPFRGIYFSTGKDHLLKLGKFCYSILVEDLVKTCIERRDSWDLKDLPDLRYVELFIVSNLGEKLYFDNDLISLINKCLSRKIGMIFTSALSLEELEATMSKTLLSNIEQLIVGTL